MSRALSVGMLTFAFLNVCWAQNKTEEPAFPFTKSIYRWDYSCPTGEDHIGPTRQLALRLGR